jgi:hypothetical protein
LLQGAGHPAFNPAPCTEIIFLSEVIRVIGSRFRIVPCLLFETRVV